MGELPGRKTFKVFNQDFIVDERYIVNKELGQGAAGLGILWSCTSRVVDNGLLANRLVPYCMTPGTANSRVQRGDESTNRRGRGHQEGHECIQ